MRRKTFSWIALGLAGGWFCWGGGGQAFAQAITGVWHSHIVQESYRIPIGVDAVGKYRKEEKVGEIRDHYILPNHYGNLVGITGHDADAVFWYQDGQGVIRNAIVPLAAKKLSRVVGIGTTRYEEDILP